MSRATRLRLLAAAAAAVLLLAATVPHVPAGFLRQGAERVLFLWHGITVVRNEMLEMADGTRLATDLYLPPVPEGGLPTVLVRLPYDKSGYGGALRWARGYAPLGYAVVLQDVRGRFASEGVFAPHAGAEADGAATLDWIARQPWSNGRIATAGCSALGEVQAIQAKSRNPHLAAMIIEAGGGAIGTGGASRSYFGVFEGGIPNLAATFGWFAQHGGKTGDRMAPARVDPMAVLGGLPSAALVGRHRADPTDYADFMSRFEERAYWQRLGYLTEADRFAAPALHVVTWTDPVLRGTFEVASLMQRRATTEAARRHQPVIVGPGLHCDFLGAFDRGQVGDLAVNPDQRPDLEAIYRAWLDHWLRNGAEPELAPFTYFVMGANRWESSDVWPPADVRPRRWYLAAEGALGDLPGPSGQAVIRYDPLDPTPSIGGPICCTGAPDLRAGPLDQRPNLGRDDLIAFVSEPIGAPLTIAGNPWLGLVVSSDAPDTDLVAVLVDVAPDGRMIAITQGALRLRYREGFDHPRPLEPGKPARARIELAPVAYRLAPGHRIGLHLSSSSFPRLERHLNGPGPNWKATEARIALNRLSFGGATDSALVLPVKP